MRRNICEFARTLDCDRELRNLWMNDGLFGTKHDRNKAWLKYRKYRKLINGEVQQKIKNKWE